MAPGGKPWPPLAVMEQLLSGLIRLMRKAAEDCLGDEVLLNMKDPCGKGPRLDFAGAISAACANGLVVQGSNYRVFVSYVDLYARHVIVVSGERLRAAVDRAATGDLGAPSVKRSARRKGMAQVV